MIAMIEVHDLTYSYPNTAASVIKSVNFDVAEGQIFGFLGPSGAGKSTTQKLLIRLLLGYGGKVTVFGRDLSDWASSSDASAMSNWSMRSSAR